MNADQIFCKANLGSTFEVGTTAYDPDLQGVGSSALLNDLSNVGITVPTTIPGLLPGNRYFFRLCSVPIPEGYFIRLRGIRQLVMISVSFVIGPNGDGGTWVEEKQVITPTWKFPDGNVVFQPRLVPTHVRVQQGSIYQPAIMGSGKSGTVYGSGVAQLIMPDDPAFAASNGLPPGALIPGLEALHDMRFPWAKTDDDPFNIVISGGQALTMYASVKQSDPAGRPDLSTITIADPSTLSDETNFVRANPLATYHRIGASFRFEVLDSHPQDERAHASRDDAPYPIRRVSAS